jgi:hypothetical protein
MTQDRVTITMACQSQVQPLLKVAFGLRLEAYFDTLPQAQPVYFYREFLVHARSQEVV